MTITHHLDDATMMSFAAGSLPSALAAVAAAHVAMCEHCRREVAVHERLGAMLMAEMAPAGMTRAVPPMPAPSLDTDAPGPFSREAPGPLARLAGGNLDDVRWRWIGPGLWHRPLDPGGQGTLQLIKAAPGAGVPEHTHGGGELTLVLRGALIDETGTYRTGDVADLDGSMEHHPVADTTGGCICVIANEQPTRFRGLLARLMQRRHGL
jgi:putative transcriptional regulator